MYYREVFDSLASTYSLNDFAAEYQKGREEYFGRVGKLFEDDPFFESRINAFLEWYLIDRIYYPIGVPLVRRHRLMFQYEMPDEAVAVLKTLEDSRHSVYLIKSVGSTTIKIQDLITEATHELKKKPEYISLQEGDVIDGRLITQNKEIQLTASFWHHPKEAGDVIAKSIKDKLKPNAGEQEFLFKLAYMRWRREHFPHVAIEQLYDFESNNKGIENAQTN